MSSQLDEPQTHKFVLELTKDELTILKYVIPRDSWGDPLKDTYELREDEPEKPYEVLKTLNEKIHALRWDCSFGPMARFAGDFAMVPSDEDAIARLHLGDENWHDGPGWYYTLDEYPDEGSCGAFATKDEAIAHAVGCGYSVEHVQPDA